MNIELWDKITGTGLIILFVAIIYAAYRVEVTKEKLWLLILDIPMLIIIICVSINFIVWLLFKIWSA